jgi:hypothetical protein
MMSDANSSAQYFLCYNNQSGTVEIYHATNAGGFHAPTVMASPNELLPPGLTNLVQFIDQPYMLYQKNGDAYASFAQVMPGPAVGSFTITHTEIADLPVSGKLVPISGADGYVAAYDDGGQLTLYQIDLAAKRANRLDSRPWGSGWTALAPLGYNSFVCLNSTTGELCGGIIQDGRIGNPVLYSDPDHPLSGYNGLTPMPFNSGPTFLAYKQHSPDTAPMAYTLEWGLTPTFRHRLTYDKCPADVASIAAFALNHVGGKGVEYFLIYQQTQTAVLALGSSTVTISSGVKPGWPDDNPPPPRRRGSAK